MKKSLLIFITFFFSIALFAENIISFKILAYGNYVYYKGDYDKSDSKIMNCDGSGYIDMEKNVLYINENKVWQNAFFYMDQCTYNDQKTFTKWKGHDADKKEVDIWLYYEDPKGMTFLIVTYPNTVRLQYLIKPDATSSN